MKKTHSTAYTTLNHVIQSMCVRTYVRGCREEFSLLAGDGFAIDGCNLTHSCSLSNLPIVCRLTCPEPYFVSEGLYSTLEELENTREVTLHVMTIGGFIEDPTKVSRLTSFSFRLEQENNIEYR